ncbi:MAG TPA: hypothetical protein VHV55_05110 [Pirellulales bacterium]|nr:hypothetical protein [Pirellulales bacterium]
MGRRTHEHEQSSDRSKIRVFYAEVDGSSQSVQDLMRTLTAAIGRPAQTVLLPPRVLQESSVGIDGDANARPSFVEAEVVEQTDATPSEDPAPTYGPQPAAKRKRGQGQKIDRNAGVAMVPHLDFLPNGKTPLKVFFSEKSPSSDMEQVLVLSHYLQHVMGIDEFGPGHIFTAFKHVVKPVPADLKGTVRNMKKFKAWLTFTDIERIRVSTVGDNFVEHELPKASANGEKGTR